MPDNAPLLEEPDAPSATAAAPQLLDEPDVPSSLSPAPLLEEPDAPSSAAQGSQSTVAPQAGPVGGPGTDLVSRGVDAVDSVIGAVPRAIGAGLWRGVFEAKDALTGDETPEANRSALRQQADATVMSEGAALGRAMRECG